MEGEVQRLIQAGLDQLSDSESKRRAIQAERRSIRDRSLTPKTFSGVDAEQGLVELNGPLGGSALIQNQGSLSTGAIAEGKAVEADWESADWRLPAEGFSELLPSDRRRALGEGSGDGDGGDGGDGDGDDGDGGDGDGQDPFFCRTQLLCYRGVPFGATDEQRGQREKWNSLCSNSPPIRTEVTTLSDRVQVAVSDQSGPLALLEFESADYQVKVACKEDGCQDSPDCSAKRFYYRDLPDPDGECPFLGGQCPGALYTVSGRLQGVDPSSGQLFPSDGGSTPFAINVFGPVSQVITAKPFFGDFQGGTSLGYLVEAGAIATNVGTTGRNGANILGFNGSRGGAAGVDPNDTPTAVFVGVLGGGGGVEDVIISFAEGPTITRIDGGDDNCGDLPGCESDEPGDWISGALAFNPPFVVEATAATGGGTILTVYDQGTSAANPLGVYKLPDDTYETAVRCELEGPPP